MTPTDTDRRLGIDRDRRLELLENNYGRILTQLDTLNEKFEDLSILKSQIDGMINLVKFVGWGGIATLVIFSIRYFSKNN